jgi:hypothetical protein
VPHAAAVEIAVRVAAHAGIGVAAERLGAALRAAGQHLADPLGRARHVDVDIAATQQVDVERADQHEQPVRHHDPQRDREHHRRKLQRCDHQLVHIQPPVPRCTIAM